MLASSKFLQLSPHWWHCRKFGPAKRSRRDSGNTKDRGQRSGSEDRGQRLPRDSAQTNKCRFGFHVEHDDDGGHEMVTTSSSLTIYELQVGHQLVSGVLAGI